MAHALNQAPVRTILEHAADYPWRMQNVGLLALRLDDHRIYRLHLWDPDGGIGDPPIHDHPYDFTSTVIAGELNNTCYIEDPTGENYRRERYRLNDENARRTDTVNLVGTSTTFGPGDHYHQRAHELHDSHPTPGTVTIIRCEWRNPPELTVCLRPGAPWVSGHGRPATPHEVKCITATALDLLTAVHPPDSTLEAGTRRRPDRSGIDR